MAASSPCCGLSWFSFIVVAYRGFRLFASVYQSLRSYRGLQRLSYYVIGPVEKHKNKPEKTTAATRQERFKTGGGLPVPPDTEELGDLLAGIIENQQPLEGIPDDDHLDSSDDLILTQDLGGTRNSQDAKKGIQQQPAPTCSNIQSPAVALVSIQQSLIQAAGQEGKG
ncbi:hypothetical protein E1301_Tti023402 [Triplophysa tibetana]|uniref:Uncharacterized protein n=1 Tax=Triplophysa tibetana TaxID=1572043 RepID=A0A5A9PMD4_9TELE|nr:hypothetical protein E1301_Tti023402 [Triplophysa tibetana]